MRWLLLAGLALSVAATPPRQDDITPPPFETAAPLAPSDRVLPTPDETGAIVVIVEPGDSMWSIAARAGISLAELFAFNGLTEGSIINPGDALIVGYATPVFVSSETIIPTATLPPPTPRPTETPAEATVCLSAFDDLNRNGIRDPIEPLRAGVAFTLYTTQAVAANYITDGRSEPKCLRGLKPGEYRITRSVAPGEILTTGGDWTLTLSAGGELHQAFGSFIDEAQIAGSGAVNPAAGPVSTPGPIPPTSESPVSPEVAAGPAPNLGLRLAEVGVLFMGGLILLGAVLILLIRQIRASLAGQPQMESDERHFRNIDDLE